jgi:putative nucleotidyltransferase with HDIG domain
MDVATAGTVDRLRVEESWRPHPILAAGLRFSIVLVPIGASLLITALLRRILPLPDGTAARLAWWAMLVIVAVSTAVAVERRSRRLLPLVAILKLGMLFPDQAPSRFQVALEAGSLRRLETRLAELVRDPARLDEATSARTILSLALALEAHDRKTRGHSERVRVYTDLIAEELRLGREDRYRLRWAALLHDIGKLSVSGRVLNKDGRLDEAEWELIRRHPSEGGRIAASLMPWLGPWGGAITEHHERVDGAGYPTGLSGHDITLAARSCRSPMRTT